MDQGRREIERLKAMRFPRSYREVHGSNFEVEPKRSKYPFVILAIVLILLIAVL